MGAGYVFVRALVNDIYLAVIKTCRTGLLENVLVFM